jgi:hypothetical protein
MVLYLDAVHHKLIFSLVVVVVVNFVVILRFCGSDCAHADSMQDYVNELDVE